MDRNPNLTAEEMNLLTSAQSEEDWNMACDCIKAVRGGAYPPDWYSRVLSNGLMDNIVGRWGATSALKVEPLTDETSIGLRPTEPAPQNTEGEVCPDCGEVHGKDMSDAEMMKALLKLLIKSGLARVVMSKKDPRTMTQEEVRELFENSQHSNPEDIDNYEIVSAAAFPTKKRGGGPVN